jgi:hypothetical protein
MTSPDTTEQWRDVPGYEGYYSVSNHGRVRSLDRQITYRDGSVRRFSGHDLHPTIHNRGGYHRVALCREGTKKPHLVQWLVAAAFLGPRPEGQVVRHLDDDPQNNVVGNLAYGTQSQNMYDAVGNYRHFRTVSLTCVRGHLLSGSNLYWKPTYPERRQCRSCVRAHAWFRHQGAVKNPEQFQAISDRFYSETVEVAA